MRSSAAPLAVLLAARLALGDVPDQGRLKKAYEAAARKEKAAAAVLKAVEAVAGAATRVDDAASRADDAARALQDAAKAQATRIPIVRGAALALKTALETAIAGRDRYAEVSTRVRSKAALFASATAAAGASQARAVDRLLVAKQEAREQALKAISAAERSEDVLTDADRRLVAEREDFGRSLARNTDTLVYLRRAAADLASELRKLDRLSAAPQALALSVSSLANVADALESSAGSLSSRLRTVSPLDGRRPPTPDVERKCAASVDEALDTQLLATVVADSRQYLMARREANLGRCPRTTACGLRLERETTAVEQRLEAAVRNARRSKQVADDAIREVEDRASRFEMLVVDFEADQQTIRESTRARAGLLAEAATAKQHAEAERDRASKAHDEAVAAARAAYVAAFGEPPPEAVLPPPPIPPPPAAYAEPNPVEAPRYSFGVTGHVYELVSHRQQETKGYGAYTYVIFGYSFALADVSIRQRYQAVIAAILASTLERSADSRSPKTLNLFCIPSTKRKRDARAAYNVLNEYSIDVGNDYLSSVIKLQRPDTLRSIEGPGPFLLTVPVALCEATSTTPMLFVDLSQLEAAIYPDVIAAYKSAVVSAGAPGTVLWNAPPSLRVASWIAGVSPTLQPIVTAIKSFVGSGGKG